MISYIIFLLAIASGIAIIIPANPIIVNPNAKGFKRIKKEGYILLISVILLVFLPLILYHLQNVDENNKKIAQDKIQYKRDSILRHDYAASILEIKNSFASTSSKTDSTISDNLGKYGFKFDSVNKRLVEIISDSAKTKIIMPDVPVLSLGGMPGLSAIQFIENDKFGYKFRVNILSADASSSFFKIKNSYAVLDTLGILTYIDTFDLLSYKDQIRKNGNTIAYFWVPFQFKFETVFAWFRGEFRDSGSTKGYTVDHLYYYEWGSKSTGIVKGETREKVISFIKSAKK